MTNKFFKDSYEVIEKKLELAELTIELSQITKEKWDKMAGMKGILTKEEELLQEIQDRSLELMALKE